MKPTYLTAMASLLVLALAAAVAPAWAQSRVDDDATVPPGQEVDTPVASHGGRVELVQGGTVVEADDPINRLVAAESVDGLMLSITLDGTTAMLDSAVLARVPKRIARANRDVQGDSVEVIGLVDGQEVARTIVPDNVLNASEGGGLVRTTRRQIAVALAVDRPLHAVRVRAAATGVDAMLDPGPAYARICEADPANHWCPRQRGAPNAP